MITWTIKDYQLFFRVINQHSVTLLAGMWICSTTHTLTHPQKLEHTNKTAAIVLKIKYRILSSCYMQTEGATAVRCSYWKHIRTQAQQYIHRHTRPYVSGRHTDPVNILMSGNLTSQHSSEQRSAIHGKHYLHARSTQRQNTTRDNTGSCNIKYHQQKLCIWYPWRTSLPPTNCTNSWIQNRSYMFRLLFIAIFREYQS